MKFLLFWSGLQQDCCVMAKDTSEDLYVINEMIAGFR